MNKETEDALHMLLHCSLKDTEYNTQKEQFKIVYDYIQNLENKIDKAIDMLDLIIPELWNISNAMTYKIKEVKRSLGGKENE